VDSITVRAEPTADGESATAGFAAASPAAASLTAAIASRKNTGSVRRNGAHAVALTGMISDLDIWRAAALLIRQHGKDAEFEAATRADLMLERGDHDGQVVWVRIMRAIAEMQTPPRGLLH